NTYSICAIVGPLKQIGQVARQLVWRFHDANPTKTSRSPTGEPHFPSAVWEKACTTNVQNLRSLRKFLGN
ncbi:MAG: hypothetical protein ACREP5_12110, partial [Candidatus Binatia bacterium]